MWQNLIPIFAIMLIESRAESSPSVISNRLNFNFCASNQSIALQVLTIDNGTGFSCQCQAEPAPAFKREEYVYTPGIGAFKLHRHAKNWNDARRICNEEGGHLAIINSRAEEAILVQMLKTHGNTIKGALNVEEAYIGIHDMFKEGEWLTVFGESLYSTGYSRWSSSYWGGQPDNYMGNQNCGALLNIGAMDDVNCVDKFGFFCELPQQTC